jgi:hypothetical protein
VTAVAGEVAYARTIPDPTGSAGSVSIGTEHSLTVGFAQEWLAWHDRQKAEREANFRSAQIFWTRFGSVGSGDRLDADCVAEMVTLRSRSSPSAP